MKDQHHAINNDEIADEESHPLDDQRGLVATRISTEKTTRRGEEVPEERNNETRGRKKEKLRMRRMRKTKNQKETEEELRRGGKIMIINKTEQETTRKAKRREPSRGTQEQIIGCSQAQPSLNRHRRGNWSSRKRQNEPAAFQKSDKAATKWFCLWCQYSTPRDQDRRQKEKGTGQSSANLQGQTALASSRARE